MEPSPIQLLLCTVTSPHQAVVQRLLSGRFLLFALTVPHRTSLSLGPFRPFMLRTLVKEPSEMAFVRSLSAPTTFTLFGYTALVWTLKAKLIVCLATALPHPWDDDCEGYEYQTKSEAKTDSPGSGASSPHGKRSLAPRDYSNIGIQPIYCVVRLRAITAPNYSAEAGHPRVALSPLRAIVPTSPPVRSGVCFANASRFKASHPTLGDHQQETVQRALQLNPLPHKYAPKSTFIPHFLFQDLIRCKPVMIPYSYTPSHKRSWALDAPSTAEDEHFPVDAIPTAPRAQPKSKALANAAASMPSARKPENRARAAATPLSAAHNRPAGSSAPSLPTRTLHVPEPVSPSPIRVQQPAATPPPLSSATSKGAAPPTQRMQAPLPKGNPVPPTSPYIPSSPVCARYRQPPLRHKAPQLHRTAKTSASRGLPRASAGGSDDLPGSSSDDQLSHTDQAALIFLVVSSCISFSAVNYVDNYDRRPNHFSKTVHWVTTQRRGCVKWSLEPNLLCGRNTSSLDYQKDLLLF
ncbi:hypothetical protein FB451DRAFT_1177203 [Mycena latifolia]|nr:hypothetical protein FB451DRAFT_1177203 [Mycena latifolia]